MPKSPLATSLVKKSGVVMSKTLISWTDETLNPLVGCSKTIAKGAKESGCRSCYAETAAASPRLQQFPQYQGVIDKHGHWNGHIEFVPKQLDKPFHMKKPRRIFMPSMSDPFHDDVRDEWLDQIMAAIALNPHLTFQMLTKRPARMREYLSKFSEDNHTHLGFVGCWASSMAHVACDNGWRKYSDEDEGLTDDCYEELFRAFFDGYLENLHLGVTVENQDAADERIPVLLKTPAAVRFLSVEPLLTELDLMEYLENGVRQAQRRNNLSRCIERETTDRRSGANLETIKKERTNNESGKNRILLPANNDLEKRKIVSNWSAQVGVQAFLRQNPDGNDDKSQGWQQEEQSSMQSGNCDLIGTDSPCIQNRTENSVWAKESCKQANRSTNGGDKNSIRDRQRDTSSDCLSVQCQPSNYFKNSERRQASDTPRHNSELRKQKDTQESVQRCDGKISLCIIGGESGRNARPFHLEWAESIIQQCQEAGVAVFVKQVGSNAFYQGKPYKTQSRAGTDPSEWPEHLRIQQFPGEIL